MRDDKSCKAGAPGPRQGFTATCELKLAYTPVTSHEPDVTPQEQAVSCVQTNQSGRYRVHRTSSACKCRSMLPKRHLKVQQSHRMSSNTCGVAANKAAYHSARIRAGVKHQLQRGFTGKGLCARGAAPSPRSPYAEFLLSTELPKTPCLAGVASPCRHGVPAKSAHDASRSKNPVKVAAE